MAHSENLHAGHRARLKEKFERVGLDAFADHEVLEFLLMFSIPQKDLNPLAHTLINHFGSLKGVLDAYPEQLKEVPGVGDHTAALISLMPQLAQRYFDNPWEGKKVSLLYPHQRKEFFIPKFIGKTTECFFAAFLNDNRDVIKCKQMFQGTIGSINLQVRLLMDEAMRYKCTGIILAHNHLSYLEPSFEDVSTTDIIAERMGSFAITVLDHIIVCGKQAMSFSENGLMSRI